MTPDATKAQIIATHEEKNLYILVKFRDHHAYTIDEAIICGGKAC
jgi:hypothetical protein